MDITIKPNQSEGKKSINLQGISSHPNQKSNLLHLFGFLCLSVVIFGFGYFFGKYEQVQADKSLLKIIPDVNCGTNKPISQKLTIER